MPTSTPERAPILAFGAHPDAIEFGCGGVVARETQAGRPAHFVVCSRGEAGTIGKPPQRSAEAEKGASLLSATIEFVDFGGDAHMQEDVAYVMTLAGIIRRIRPAIVLAPSTAENQHPDHAVLGRMVRNAARLAHYGGISELKAWPIHPIDQLLFYAVTVEGEPADLPRLLFDVSPAKVVAAWTTAMEAHSSQMHTRNYVELQLARARLNGLGLGVSHAISLFPNDTLLFESLKQLGRAARRF